MNGLVNAFGQFRASRRNKLGTFLLKKLSRLLHLLQAIVSSSFDAWCPLAVERPEKCEDASRPWTLTSYRKTDSTCSEWSLICPFRPPAPIQKTETKHRQGFWWEEPGAASLMWRICHAGRLGQNLHRSEAKVHRVVLRLASIRLICGHLAWLNGKAGFLKRTNMGDRNCKYRSPFSCCFGSAQNMSAKDIWKLQSLALSSHNRDVVKKKLLG